MHMYYGRRISVRLHLIYAENVERTTHSVEKIKERIFLGNEKSWSLLEQIFKN